MGCPAFVRIDFASGTAIKWLVSFSSPLKFMR